MEGFCLLANIVFIRSVAFQSLRETREDPTFAEREWIPVEARRALALVTAGQVLADRVDAAGGLLPQLHALVDVPALAGLVVARVTALADAHAVAREFILDALLSGGAGRTRAAHVGCLGYLAAAAVGIALHAARALAREGAGLVVADRARRTRIYRALVDVPAAVLHAGLAGVTVAAEAGRHVVQQHAVRVRPAGQVLAWV